MKNKKQMENESSKECKSKVRQREEGITVQCYLKQFTGCSEAGKADIGFLVLWHEIMCVWGHGKSWKSKQGYFTDKMERTFNLWKQQIRYLVR